MVYYVMSGTLYSSVNVGLKHNGMSSLFISVEVYCHFSIKLLYKLDREEQVSAVFIY